MLDDGQREIALGYRDVQLALADRNGHRRAAIQDGRDFFDQLSIERADRNLRRSMDLLTLELRHDLTRVAMRVDRDAAGELAASVQAVRIWHPHLDPSGDTSGKVAYDERRLVAR